MRIILKIIGSLRLIDSNCKGVDMEVKNKRDVPKIRFNTYRKKWKKKKFKDFTKLSQGLQIAISDRFTEDAETRHFYITNEFLNPNSRKKYYIESPSENVICTVDDILMTRTGNTGKVITNVSGAFHNNFFKVTYEKNDTAKLFLYYLLLSYDVQKEILIRAGNSTIPDLNHGDFYSIKTFIPIVEEQSAIGSLFRIVDDLIASYKDNLSNYQSLKAVMLSKMFPKAGQTVPEIRLDGFKGEWEVKKLENVIEFYAGLTYKPNDMVSDGTLVLRSSNVRDGEFIYKDNVFVNPDIVNCQNVKLGDIVVVVRNGSRDLIGKHALIKSEMPNTVIGAFMTGVRCEVPEFVNALLDTNMFISEINKNLGATINQITTGNFKRMKFHFPDKEEQQVIGSYFANLDDLIAAHQEKISQLETLKKKFLQDMFI